MPDTQHMKRLLTESLLSWKEQSVRKPLLMQGARQVGKTYLLERFGESEFPNYHLFDFTASPPLHRIFEPDLNPQRIVQDLSIYTDREISLERDLIVFDEIQECPAALTSLKYFQKDLVPIKQKLHFLFLQVLHFLNLADP